MQWTSAKKKMFDLDKKLFFINFYSEPDCLFAHHFAILSWNVVFIGSLLRASCGLKFQLAESWSSSVVLEVKSDVSGTVKTLWRLVCQFSCTKPNYRSHGITRASEESSSCSLRYLRRLNQDLVQGCTVVDFRKHQFTWTAAPARNFPTHISLLMWLLQASAPESQGKWLIISFEKFSKLTATTTRNWAHETVSIAKSKLELKILFTPSDDCHESELGSTFNWKDSKKEQLTFPLWNRGNVAFHRSQLTVFQYENLFAQAANRNLNCNLLGANCQSNTNIAWQYCEVARKRTTGLTVKTWKFYLLAVDWCRWFTRSTCSELWWTFRNTWLQAWLILLVLPL